MKSTLKNSTKLVAIVALVTLGTSGVFIACKGGSSGSAAVSTSPAPGDENLETRTDDELTADSQTLNTKEEDLAKLRVRFEEKFSSIRIQYERDSDNVIAITDALRAYIQFAGSYLTKYEKFKQDDGIYTLRKKDIIKTKIVLAKRTLSALAEEENRVLRTQEKQEKKNAELANLPNYPREEVVNVQQAYADCKRRSNSRC